MHGSAKDLQLEQLPDLVFLSPRNHGQKIRKRSRSRWKSWESLM